MKKPMQAARTLLSIAVLFGAIGMTACARDTTAPLSSATDANKALLGATDQTYTFIVDPKADSPRLYFGASYIAIPANSICAIVGSSYGPGTWKDSCVSETLPVIIKATVHNAATNNPSVDFEPAMRFNPAVALPTLLFSVTNNATLSNMSVVKYCASALLTTTCTDESLTDASLATTVDKWNNIVWRKIRHFSGYTVAE